MELKELLELVFKVQPNKGMDELVDGYKALNSTQLGVIFDELSKTKAFKNAKLHIIDNLFIVSSGKTETLQTKAVQTMKLSEGSSFSGDVYIHSISLSPKLYDPKSYTRFTKEDAVVTPCIYDVETFIPHKYMILKWSPENAQDMSTLDGKDFRQYFHKLLDNVLDSIITNDDKYTIKSNRAIMIRGIWDNHSGNEESMTISID